MFVLASPFAKASPFAFGFPRRLWLWGTMMGDKAGFVDKNQTPGNKPTLILFPLRASVRHRRPILFGGEQCFLKLKPALRSSNPLTQIIRIRFRHPYWPPLPSQYLEAELK